MTLAQAWEKFDKAMSFDQKAGDSTNSDSLRRMAKKGVDKYLDEATALEAAAVAAGERHS